MPWGLEEGRTQPPVVAVAERLETGRADAPPLDARLVVAHAPEGAAAEAFRALYYSLRRAQGGAPLGVLGVTSADRGDGRTLASANLALVAARESGSQTLVVDANLRTPTLHRLFGLDGELGLSDVAANRCDLPAAIVSHGKAGIDVLAGGRPDPEPARRFASPRFQRVLALLRERYHEVIVDLPPAPFADTRLLAVQCSSVVVVVRAGRTGTGLAREALEALAGARVAGVVLNAASEVDAPALRAARKALGPGRGR